MDLAEFERRFVVRFDRLQPTAGSPPDTVLPQFVRDRLMLLGRRSERTADEGGPDVAGDINLAYVRCDPGKGFCSHAHPGWEIFVPMDGRWRIEVEGRDAVDLGPWDAMVVPGGLFHGAVNIGDTTAVMLGINPGMDTAKFTLAPDVLAAIAAARPAHD